MPISITLIYSSWITSTRWWLKCSRFDFEKKTDFMVFIYFWRRRFVWIIPENFYYFIFELMKQTCFEFKINVTIKFDAYTHSARTETIQKMQPIRSTAQAILNYYHQLQHESTMNAQSRRMNDGRTRCSAVEHRMNNTLKSIGNRKRAAIVEHIWGSAHSQSPHICVLVLQTQTAYERCSKV